MERIETLIHDAVWKALEEGGCVDRDALSVDQFHFLEDIIKDASRLIGRVVAAHPRLLSRQTVLRRRKQRRSAE